MSRRPNRHLIETARILEIYVGIPKYSGECVKAATHLINLMPSVVRGWETPYKRLLNKKAEYKHLRIISCLCSAFNIDRKFDKFEEK